MIEILNGPLLTFLTVMCTLGALAPYFVKPILSCLCRISPEERSLFSQIMELKAQQNGFSMKDEFAAYSRLQRKIIKLETELKEVSQSRASTNLTIKSTLSYILQGFFGFIILCCVIWYRYEPLVRLDTDLTPVSSLLSYPTKIPNAISAHMWVVISKFATASLLKCYTL